MRPAKSFTLGAFYLVSGIYSLGFGLFLVYTTGPISGNPAFFTSKDTLFPIEVAIFTVFGLSFIIAAAYHFAKTVKTASLTGLTSEADRFRLVASGDWSGIRLDPTVLLVPKQTAE